MPRWEIDRAGQPPADALFHEGAIRYFKEQGLWTEEHQAWNEARQARLDALEQSWAAQIEQFEQLVFNQTTKAGYHASSKQSVSLL